MKNLGFINVLGVSYTIYLYDDFKKLNDDAEERDKRYLYETKKDHKLDGYTDFQAKEIRIFKDEYTSQEYFEQTIRHELTHALLYEIGNSNFDDEDYVDKISKWAPLVMLLQKCGLELINNAGIEEESTSTQID